MAYHAITMILIIFESHFSIASSLYCIWASVDNISPGKEGRAVPSKKSWLSVIYILVKVLPDIAIFRFFKTSAIRLIRGSSKDICEFHWQLTDKFLTAFMTFLLDEFRDDLSWNASKSRQLKSRLPIRGTDDRWMFSCSEIFLVLLLAVDTLYSDHSPLFVDIGLLHIVW